MTFHAVCSKAVLAAVAFACACSSQPSESDRRVAELQKQLADSQAQLEASQKKLTDPPEAQPAKAAPAPKAARPVQTRTTPPKAPPPGVVKQPPAPAPAPVNDGEAERVARLETEVARQAEANAALQRQVEQLKPKEFVLPTGTAIAVRTTSEVSTDRVSDGSAFDALLEHDLTSGDVVLAKAGSRVTGFVVSSDPGGRVKGVASLSVGVRSIAGANGIPIGVRTDSFVADAENTKKKDTVRTGIATGLGALIGAIAGGGKGAAIGAGTGAAAGVGTNMATRGAAAVIPAEELIEFRLVSPVTVVIQP